MADNLTCPKCAGTMEPGAIPDMGFRPISWQRNTEEKGFFGGLKQWGVKRIEMTTYRCMKCGYLESYAKD